MVIENNRSLYESLHDIVDYLRDRTRCFDYRAAGIIVADNIVTRGALNKGLDMIRIRELGACRLTTGRALARKGEVALRTYACACTLRKYRAFTVNVVRARLAVQISPFFVHVLLPRQRACAC